MPTLPTALQIIPSVELDAGVAVASDGLDKLGQNNNYAWARYGPGLGAGLYPAPLTPAGAGYVEHLQWPVPASVDEWGLRCVVYADPGATTGRVRLASGADVSLVQTETMVAGSGPQWVTIDLSRSAGADDTLSLYAEGANTVVYSASLAWKPFTAATTTYNPRSSGFRFVNDSASGASNAETAADRPVTDELVNRLFTNPRLLFADRRPSLFAAMDDLNATARWKTIGGASRGPVVAALVHVRYPCTVEWLIRPVVSGGATLWSVTITDLSNADAPLTVTQASSSESWGGVAWYRTAQMVLDRGDHIIHVELATDSGGSSQLDLRSLSALVVP
jgi:hypothetical protein